MFFEELVKRYIRINFPEQYQEIAKTDKAISWYLADASNQLITVSKTPNVNLVEIDIRQAFTTICNNLFSPGDEFITQMNAIEDKKSRNIFIATSLNAEYLRLLNIISKIIIFGIVFELEKNITLLELKKDGILITCDDNTLEKISNILKQESEFIQYVVSKGFEFHVTQYQRYIRSIRTSYLVDNSNNIIVKGIFKHSPSYIRKLQKEILLDNFEDFKEVLEIYSQPYFNILINNHLNDLLEKYYICDNKRYLNKSSKYVLAAKKNEIDPRNYIKVFIYPVTLSTKSQRR